MRVLIITGIYLAASSQAFSYQPQPLQRGVYSVQDSMGEIRHDIDNHEAEIRMFEERLDTQETIIDSLRQQMLDASLNNRELLKGNSSTFESSLAKTSMEVKTLQNHFNESSKVLNLYKQKIEALESKIDQMQTALQSVLNALNIGSSEESYAVKSGDSLDKIARRNNTTIQKIKDLNGLKSDRIFIGQQLKLP